MRTILKSILLFILLSISLYANNQKIDECKTDLYYANGVGIDETRFDAREIWKSVSRELLATNPKERAKIGKIDISYNASQGFLDDIFESFEQQMSNEWGWTDFSNYFRVYLELKGIQDSIDKHRPNLDAQIAAYKESIKLGHGVVVVAHSQGNYYTNEAYQGLDNWMKDYFNMMGVATPADHVAGGGPHVTFHNDIINMIPTALPSNLDDTRHHGFPSYDAHDFYESYMKEETSKKMIMDFILDKVQAHSKTVSQWELDQELNVGTTDYKITLKHRFDTSITSMQDVEVYPFKPSEKLYHVIDNTPNGNGWVKATCGGKEVFDSWTGQESNEAYLIDNLKKEIIKEYKLFSISRTAIEVLPVVDYIEDYYSDQFLMYYYPYNSYILTISNCPSCSNGYTLTHTLQYVGAEGLYYNHDNNVNAMIEQWGSISALKSYIDSQAAAGLFLLPHIASVSTDLINDFNKYYKN
jgi:hypothetical protein